MGSAVESVPIKAPGLKSSNLKVPLTLFSGTNRLSVEPDGSVGSLYSISEKRSLFGLEQVRFYKVQAGIVVQAPRLDWSVRVTPKSVSMNARVFDSVEISQVLEFLRGASVGYLRRIKVRNAGQTPLRLRVLEHTDPTAANTRASSDVWGSLGVNAFNRESHVAMDEVSDPPSARVVGSTPPPSRFYMTTNRTRALELVSAGELPDPTAGMSGQVMILSTQDVDLSPGEVKELVFYSLYNSGKLEDALTDFRRIQSGDQPPSPRKPWISASDPLVTEAAAWAVATVEGGVYSPDQLDAYEVLKALNYASPDLARRAFEWTKPKIRKDGSLPHSLDPSSPGVLETAVFLEAFALSCLLTRDKKALKGAYPLLRKVAGYLLAASKSFTVTTDSRLPQGWRRRLGSGYPTGEIPEISLAVSEALLQASQVARLASKNDDAAKFRERAEMITEQVRKRLVDERGFLATCKDSTGRLRSDETVDMAVACYRHQFMTSAEQASAHRLLEKDFDTPYGPRTVPNTNQVYFNGSYGQGQLGGVWPRATLAHSVACYRAELPGLGSLSLSKAAHLVVDDALRFGMSPGTFPEWVDVDSGVRGGATSDPVAAARFLEAILEGELGFTPSDRPSIQPRSSSGLGWVMSSGFWAGEPLSAFVGRSGGKAHLFYSAERVESKSGMRFAKSEPLELPYRGVSAISFNGPGQVICVGNGTGTHAKLEITFTPRGTDLTKHLSNALETYDPALSSWSKSGILRVAQTMNFEASIPPGEWKAFRVSTA